MSELIRLLSKDAGGSKHYTGGGEGQRRVANANHGGKMFGLRRQDTEPGGAGWRFGEPERGRREGKTQKKMCCSHWFAEEEFMKVALEKP